MDELTRQHYEENCSLALAECQQNIKEYWNIILWHVNPIAVYCYWLPIDLY